MKTKTSFLTLAILLSVACFISCKNETESASKKVETKDIDKDTIPFQDSKTPNSFKSQLRPNEDLLLEKVYKDTIRFIKYDDNLDYWYFLALKEKDTITIVYYADESISKLLNGDALLIHWKLKKIENAGDPELSEVKPYLVSFQKIASEKTTKVLWRENLYDEQLKTELSTLVFNTAYLQTLSQQEKAALGYITTFIGNECEWDGGKPNEDRSNLDCQFLSALNLGYQCSNEHLGFLKHWFSQDPKTLEKLESCPTLPNTATLQSTFNDISIEVREEEHLIIIQYNYQTINLREGTVEDRFKTAKFEYSCESIILLSS